MCYSNQRLRVKTKQQNDIGIIAKCGCCQCFFELENCQFEQQQQQQQQIEQMRQLILKLERQTAEIIKLSQAVENFTQQLKNI